jgi:short-subunit dehydrogenase
MNLSGKRVLVTGAAGGIGHHIVSTLLERGAVVLAHDVDLAAFESAGLPDDVVKLPADLRDMHNCERLIERAGAIDVLVNCAGLEYTGRYDEQGRGEIEDLVRVNLLAPMMLTRVVLPGMLERRSGHVVNIASIAGKGPTPFLTVYGATKAGLISLSQSLRAEYRGSGVSFSVIAPGFVSDEGMYARMEGEAPMALGTSTPQRVAEAVVKVIEHDRPEKIVASRPMRPLFVLNQVSPRLGELGITAFGAKRFLRKVGERRGRG